ncbi:MAG: phosphocarrier protein HPr [Verrucomicrobiota bacterium]|jgi:phosphotransferase system HPr (HPr) family protein|nr:phosphocarrier protein HPr [Verrucomicrobiota bacterium]
MVAEKILIHNPTGLHTRPAKNLVGEAKKFESDITVIFKGKRANLKSLIKVLKLGISQNNFIELLCDGPDEQEALAHLKNFILAMEG